MDINMNLDKFDNSDDENSSPLMSFEGKNTFSHFFEKYFSKYSTRDNEDSNLQNLSEEDNYYKYRSAPSERIREDTFYDASLNKEVNALSNVNFAIRNYALPKQNGHPYWKNTMY